MSISMVLHLQALNNLVANARNLEQRLQALIELDIEKAKAEIKDGLAHFKAEIARVRSFIDEKVLAHFDDGVPPEHAVALAAQGVLSKSESIGLPTTAPN